MNIREIEDHEIDAVAGLLAEGFPGHDVRYWQETLLRVSRRPKIGELPKLGFVLEVDGQLQGVILVLSSEVDGAARSNLSSWYVREEHRKYATFLYQRAIKAKGTTYLNLSPSVEALPIAKAFGFKPYTGGTLRLDGRCILRLPGRGKAHAITQESLARLDARDRQSCQAHLDYGCRGLILEDGEGLMPALYRTKKLRKLVPAARFVSGETERLLRAAPVIGKHLLFRGIPFFLLDAPKDWSPDSRVTHLPDQDVRYAKNAPAPAIGDLRETEISIFFP